MAVHYRQAALRAYDDAQSLDRQTPPATRLGTMDHLYGLAAECALKAVLVGLGAFVATNTRPPRPYGVHIDQLWNQYAAFVSGRSAVFTLPTTNEFIAWRVDDRYEEDATVTPARLAQHQRGAVFALLVLEAAITAGVVR